MVAFTGARSSKYYLNAAPNSKGGRIAALNIHEVAVCTVIATFEALWGNDVIGQTQTLRRDQNTSQLASFRRTYAYVKTDFAKLWSGWLRRCFVFFLCGADKDV